MFFHQVLSSFKKDNKDECIEKFFELSIQAGLYQIEDVLAAKIKWDFNQQYKMTMLDSVFGQL